MQRNVLVNVPGHLEKALPPQLMPAEQKVDYEATAVELAERHKSAQHGKAWGAAHSDPGIRFASNSDAIDDPDHKGFWTTLSS